jgi:hypothetical protein
MQSQNSQRQKILARNRFLTTLITQLMLPYREGGTRHYAATASVEFI